MKIPPALLKYIGLLVGLQLAYLFPGGSNHSPRLIFMGLVAIVYCFSLVIDAKNKRIALIAACVMSVFIIVMTPITYDIAYDLAMAE
ncbi:MAG: hypothetical protein LBE21_02225 [Pseudomonadales bacterium]|nr:hypothetical protein [Pseudomonadales bacterium]